LAIFFSENRPFSPDFGGSCCLLAIFRPQKKSLDATAAATPYCGLWSRVFNLFFSKEFLIFKILICDVATIAIGFFLYYYY